MNLSELKFQVDTAKLKEAVDRVKELSGAVSNLNKVTSDETKAAIENEKVKQQQAKTAEAIAKAKVAEEKATKSSSVSAKENTSVLERQQNILNYMTQGYSKGQATVLAYAQASGAATSEIKELGNVLEIQRKLMGASPFDKSMSGLVALKNQYGEVREAIRQYNADSGLTASQTRDLARDKERIIEKLKQEGAGLTQIKQAIREYNSAYIDTASKVNNLAKAEKDRERVMRDTANAARNIQAAEERLFATVSHLGDVQNNNVKVNERAALAIGSYERNLRLAGITGEEAARKLAKFKAAQEQVSAAEAKTRANYVARGVGVQAGDVMVSLASGMNPLTVAIQQGDQIRGLLQQSGLEAAQMSGIMKQAFAGIITSFRDVGVAMGAFVVGGLQSMGKSFIDLTEKTLPFKATLSFLERKFPDAAGGISLFTKSLAESKVVTGLVGAALSAFIGSLIAIGISTIAAAKEQYKLNQVLSLQGATLGLNTDAAYAYANSMEAIGIRQTDTIAVITEMAKAGKLSSDSVEMITKAAVKLKEQGGVAIEETVKNFSDLGKDPVKAVESLNEKYGFLTSSVYLQIKALQEQGNTAAATKLAQQSYADMIDSRAKTMEENLGTLASAWKSLGIMAANAWDSMLNLGRDNPEEKLQQALATMQGKSYLQGGLFSGDKSEALSIIRMYEATAEAKRKANDEQQKNNRSTEGTIELERLHLEFADKKTKKQLELNKAHEAYAKSIAGAAGDSKLQLEIARKYEATVAGINEKYKEKTKVSKEDNYFAQTLERISDLNIKATQTTEDTSKAQQLFLDIVSNPNWAKFNEYQRVYIANEIEKVHANEISNNALKEQKKLQEDILKIQTDYGISNQKDIDEINNKIALLGLTENEKTLLQAKLKAEQDRLAVIQRINAEVAKSLASGNISVFDAEAQRISRTNAVNSTASEQAKNLVAANQALINQSQSFKAGWDDAFAAYRSNLENTANLGRETFNLLSNSFSQSFMDFVTRTKTAGQAFKAFAQSVIQGLLKMIAQQMIFNALSSFSGPSGGGSGGIGALFSSFKLFADGGYTGMGAANEPAGIVHKGEIVWSQQDIAKAGGVTAVEAMRKGLGSNSAFNSPSVSAPARSVPTAISVNVENYGISKDFEVQQLSESQIRIIARDEAKTTVQRDTPNIVASQIKNPNSAISKSINQNTQAQRRR